MHCNILFGPSLVKIGQEKCGLSLLDKLPGIRTLRLNVWVLVKIGPRHPLGNIRIIWKSFSIP